MTFNLYPLIRQHFFIKKHLEKLCVFVFRSEGNILLTLFNFGNGIFPSGVGAYLKKFISDAENRCQIDLDCIWIGLHNSDQVVKMQAVSDICLEIVPTYIV